MKNRIRPEISTKRNPKRKSRTLPDQSLTPQEILDRFVKGEPINLQAREAVYIDQDIFDYEQLGRMEFDQKDEYARMIKERANAMLKELEARELANEEAMTKERSEQEEKLVARVRAQSNIDSLDNTMLRDTKPKSK